MITTPETKELNKAWRKFNRTFDHSKDFIPGKEAFKAGYEFCKSLQTPKPTKKIYKYIIVNYKFDNPDYNESMVFQDKDGKDCIIVSKETSNYVKRNFDVRWRFEHLKDIMLYDTREQARFDVRLNKEDSPDINEVVWKVEVNEHSQFINWIKKTP